MAEDQIRYDILVKDALRSVIKKVLADVAKNGLPDAHHFFITFLTEYPGVKISSRLKKSYPQQMTIVLQHQFWGLKVSDNAFEVSLSFSNIPETLTIPFNAIQIFLDPIAAFETTFDLPADASNNNQKDGNDIPFFSSSHVSHLLKNTELKAKTDKNKEKAKTVLTKDTNKDLAATLSPINKVGNKKSQKKKFISTQVEKPTAEIVSLEAFRKNKD